MKKEYLILTALILILGAYLLLHKENKDHYTLPEIKKIDTAKVTGLILGKKEGQITFSKKEKQWVLTDKEYTADSSAVNTMLDDLKTLKLSTLVSQKGDLHRYDLDDDSRIQIQIMAGEKALFDFTMGKAAPTANHTFVMLAGDKNIYHANGNFRSHFDKTVEDFRDKKVVAFKEASIKRLTIEKDGVSKTLFSKEAKTDKKEAVVTWSTEDGQSADKAVIGTLLSSLSFLECETYSDAPAKDELENKEPLCTIQLENEGIIEVTIFSTDTEDMLAGLSSMSPYAFTLNQFSGKEIVSNIETLLGIAKSKEK